MNPFTTKNDPLASAASLVLAEAAENAMTALDLRKKYGGAYVSSMDFKEYELEPKYVDRIKDFMRKNRLSPKETAVFHEDGFAKYESFPAMLRLLDKKKIVYDDFKDSTSAGVIVFSLKPVVAEETDLEEAKFKFNPAKHEVQVSDKRSGGKFSITVVDKATNSKVLHRMTHELPMAGEDGDVYHAAARVRDAKRVLGEEAINEAPNGFQTNRSVTIAKQNLAMTISSFKSTGFLAKLVIKEVGDGAKQDFEKIEKMLSQIEDIWDELYREASMAYDADINK